MRHINISLMLLIFVTSLFSVDFSFEIVKGKYTSSSEENLSRADLIGIRNNFYFDPNFALSLKYDMVDNKSVTNRYRVSANLRYQVNEIDESFSPFFEIGLGKESNFSSDKFQQGVVGFKYFFYNNINFLTEATFIRKSGHSRTYFLGAGFGYDFYKKPTSSKYSDKPLDEEMLKSLATHKIDIKEDIFLSPY